MKSSSSRCRGGLLLGGLLMAICAASTGCTIDVAGQTLPSPYHLTDDVQYYAPGFRYIAAQCPEVDLMVLYGTEPTAAQQGVGFGVAFQWDTPLVEGYRCRILRAPRSGQSVHSERFWGLDVPEIGAALEESRPDVALIPGWHSVTLVRALWTCRRARIPTLYRGDTHLGHRPTGWRGAVRSS